MKEHKGLVFTIIGMIVAGIVGLVCFIFGRNKDDDE